MPISKEEMEQVKKLIRRTDPIISAVLGGELSVEEWADRMNKVFEEERENGRRTEKT